MQRKIFFRAMAALIVMLAVSINTEAQRNRAVNRAKQSVEQKSKKEAEQKAKEAVKDTAKQKTPTTTQSSTLQLVDSSTPIQVSISGNISTTKFSSGSVATISFSRFPANVDEWKQVREEIGETIPGAVALQIMACELYCRDKAVGTECLKLNTVTSSQTNYISLLRDVSNSRPYQFAGYLKGASASNGYNPTKPYTIEVRVTATSYKEYSNAFQAEVFKFFIKSNGHELNDGLQPVAVMKTARPNEPSENKYYIISELSSIFLQCKEKSFTVDFNGLD